jgi:hypothetical protein
VYEGAENNLPDQAAMNTAQHIQTMISNTMCTDDILLVLISGKVLFIKHRLMIILLLFYYLFVYKKVFIGQTLDLDFQNSRQNAVEDVRCWIIIQPKYFHQYLLLIGFLFVE